MIGKKIRKFKVGQKVAALVNGGGYAEYCIADEKQTFSIPRNLSFEEAAGIPECFFTAWSNLVNRAQIKNGQNVLIHGGTSGIGLASLQILKLFNVKTFTTVGNSKKIKFCKKLGVDFVYNYKEVDFFEEIKKNKFGIDTILDFIGGKYINKNLNLLRNDGKLINIGFQEGSKVELNLMKVMLKRLIITGSTLRVRDKNFKNKILKELEKKIFPFFETGKIKCFVDSVFKLEDASLAHKRMDQGEHIGKIILKT